MPRIFDGVNQTQEYQAKRVFKESIPFWKSCILSFFDKDFVTVSLVLGAAGICVFPAYLEVFRLCAIVMFAGCMIRYKKTALPMRVPLWAKTKDYNSPVPGRSGFKNGTGIMFMGNMFGNNSELWTRKEDICTHTLVLGTTGAGKTVSLESMAYNAFCMGTGLVYVDPKADPKLGIEIFLMARRMGRDDDYRVLNFITGGRKAAKVTPFRVSNTINPFAFGSSDSLVNLITSLLGKSEGGNSVFQQKAQALITGIIPILASLRDKKIALPMSDVGNYKKGQFGTGLSITTIRDYLDPILAVSLVAPIGKTDDGNTPAKKLNECDLIRQHGGVEQETLDSMKAVLSSLNYNRGKGVTEQQAFLEQYGYAKGYFAQTLVSLSGTYGHIFNVSQGEIDMHDILLNRRIFVCMLPSLEKSPQEIENLGKIILSSIKNAVSVGLGTKLEGATDTVLGSLPSASNIPSLIVVDEYAAIMTPGFATILTQARSLGFAAIIASQDYAGMKGADEKEAEQIIANTNTKLFMKIVEAKQTWELIKALFGQAYVEEVNLEDPSKRGRITQRDRVSQIDLMQQIEGEFHAFFSGSLIRGFTPYMVPAVKAGFQMRILRMIRTDVSKENVITGIKKQLEDTNYLRRVKLYENRPQLSVKEA